MSYTKASWALFCVILISFVQCAAMHPEELEQKEETAAQAQTDQRPPSLCKECFEHILNISGGALMLAAATGIHEHLDCLQYGCLKPIPDTNPMRDIEFLLGNIACAVCGACGAAYSLYELCKLFIFARNNRESICCFCRRIERYLAYEEQSQQENPAPVDPTQPESLQPV